MPGHVWLSVLAQAPTSGIYIDPFKLAALLVLFTLWALYAQWTDKDTIAVNTYREIWNLANILGATVGLIAWLLLPHFWIGLAIFVVLNGSIAIAYVLHRNARVVEEDRILTREHIGRLLRGGKDKQQKLAEVKERVRLADADERRVEIPEEPEARHQYALVQDLLFDALWRRAGRVDILPAGPQARVRLVIDGVASERDPLPREDAEAILFFLKKIAGLDTEERRKPQRGKMRATIGDTEYEIQVRTQGSTAGEALSLRIIGQEKNFKVDDLGLTESQLEQMRQVIEADHGLVLVSALPGGGLTTTLYSLIRSHDAFLLNIQTLEYEQEMEVENVTQRVYTPSEEKPFSAELQRLVRADPDVVLLPEVRDRPSAEIATEAAARKVKVIVGLRATDVFDAYRRWAQQVGDPKRVAKATLAVTHQRLLRKLCPTCKTAYKPDAALMRKLNLPANAMLYKPPEPEYDKHGNPIVCQHCQGTGYVGRTAVFNVIVFDDELRQMVLAAKSLSELKTAAAAKGVRSLQQHALEKVLAGETSIEEVIRATRTPKPSAKQPVAKS